MRPLVITGLPRSCTTILHEAIRRDPANRVPLTWEARYPTPPPEAATYETDPRIAATEQAYDALHAMVPELKAMVPMSGRSVIECSSFMAYEFACDLFDPTFDIPSYRDWLWEQDITETYETYRKILQHLSWRCARDRWVLKAPTHLRTLDALLAVFPDACIVQNHRDPLLSLASVISLRLTMLKPTVAELDVPRLARWISQDNAEWLARGLETRRRLNREDRFFDVYFNDFQSDPEGVVTRLYAHFDLPLGDEALSRIRKFLGENPRGKHGVHNIPFRGLRTRQGPGTGALRQLSGTLRNRIGKSSGMSGSLSQMRVLELGEGVSAAIAARLFGDHGAEVVKVEEPEGDSSRRRGPFPGGTPDPERSGLFLALNTNKRGVCLDLESEAGRAELRALIDWADVLVHNCSRGRAAELGIDADSLLQQRPDLVTLLAYTVWRDGSLRGLRGRGIDCQRRRRLGESLPGRHGATRSAAAQGLRTPMWTDVRGRGRHGGDGGLHGTPSAAALGSSSTSRSRPTPRRCSRTRFPTTATRASSRPAYGSRMLIPWRIFDCRDGPLFLACIEQDQWERLVELMGNPEWAKLEVFATVPGRADNHDVVHSFVQEWLAEKSANLVYHEMQEHRVCAAPVMSLAQISESRTSE